MADGATLACAGGASFAVTCRSMWVEAGDYRDLLGDYIAINRDLRKRNADTLRQLAAASREAFLWDRAFGSLPNAQVSHVASARTYL